MYRPQDYAVHEKRELVCFILTLHLYFQGYVLVTHFFFRIFIIYVYIMQDMDV